MDRYVLQILFALSAKAGQLNFASCICVINILCLQSVYLKKNRKEGKSKSKSPRADASPPPRVDAPPPPPPSDAAASTASQESHVTSPVVFMPLNQDLIDANLTVEQLQTFQHVDNVVEVQLQPSPVPPQSTTVVDTAFFERVNNMMNTFDNLIPLLTKVASDRRSPTAGSSESVSLNPLASLTDSAPQFPVVAPQSPGLALDLHRPLRSLSLPPQASSSDTKMFSPPHVVVRARGTALKEVAMPLLRFKIV